jgi:hypothetical protein
MDSLLIELGHFTRTLLTFASGFLGLFLFLLMMLTGWTEKKQKPIASKVLIWGGAALCVFWLWIQIVVQVASAMKS